MADAARLRAGYAQGRDATIASTRSSQVTEDAPGEAGAAAGQVRSLLRIEGVVILAASICGYSQFGAGWGLFATLFLVPDFSMLGYLAGPRVGAAIYNAAHSTVGPSVLLGIGALGSIPLALAVGLIWAAHVGLDRALGYGLKYGDEFGHTHLGRIGRPDPW